MRNEPSILLSMKLATGLLEGATQDFIAGRYAQAEAALEIAAVRIASARTDMKAAPDDASPRAITLSAKGWAAPVRRGRKRLSWRGDHAV